MLVNLMSAILNLAWSYAFLVEILHNTPSEVDQYNDRFDAFIRHVRKMYFTYYKTCILFT